MQTGYCDDDDFGCAKQMTDLMVQNKISNRAIFVVRACGEKLNAERYRMYQEAAKQVIGQYPRNDITGEIQQITIQDGADPKPTGSRGYKRSNYRGRGRGRGSSRGGGRGGAKQPYRGRERVNEEEEEKTLYIPKSALDYAAALKRKATRASNLD